MPAIAPATVRLGLPPIANGVGTSIPGAIRRSLHQGKSLKLDKLLSLADVDQERRRSLAAGEVERPALLAVEAHSLPRIERQANAGRRGRGGGVRIAFF